MIDVPVSVDLIAYRGDTWSETFRITSGGAPIDLTGATVASWATDLDGVKTELTTVVDVPNAAITIMFPSNVVVRAGHYSYDIESTKDDIVTTWVRGRLVVQQDITNRDDVAA